jgi:hypothetical protein
MTETNYSYQNLPHVESLKDFAPERQTVPVFFTRKIKMMALLMLCFVLVGSMFSAEVIHRNRVRQISSSTTDASKSFPAHIDNTDTNTKISPVVDEEAETAQEDNQSVVVTPAAVTKPTPAPTAKVVEVEEEAEEEEEEEEEVEVEAPAANNRVPNDLLPKAYSDSRLSPLFMSYAASDFGWLRALFSKYAFIGNRALDKTKYTAPVANLTLGRTGAVQWNTMGC